MSRPAAQERLGRLLAIVPWVAGQDGPLVSEVCRRFGVSEPELLADLDLLFLCGVHPFTPDSLIEVDVSDGRVWIRMADWFRRPLRLTPPEGLALVSAGAALLATPGADRRGALGRALGKLEAVLGVGADDAVEVDLGPVSPPILEAVQEALAQQRKLRIDYYSFGRDGRSTRVVHPWKVFNARSQWYLTAWCETARGERLFRVDRIRAAEVVDEEFVHPGPAPDCGPGSPGSFGGSGSVGGGSVGGGGGDSGGGPLGGERRGVLYAPQPGDPTVVLDLDPPAHWVAEQYPNEGVSEQPGGVLRVRLRTSERAWLERVLLQVGPFARVIEGDDTIGPRSALRVLARYRVAETAPPGP